MELPDSVQNILAYGQGYKDGMKDGHICGFHDALVCNIHDLAALLKKYAELEKEWAASQGKAKRERLENMPQMEQPAEQKHVRWIPTEYDSYADGAPVWDKFECSECGHEHSGEEDTLTAFCPDCGAKMDGKDINVITKDGGADNG